MIMPLNLPEIDDKKLANICIKHINKGLLKGIDLAIANFKSVDDVVEYFRPLFPRGFYGDYEKELYRLRDIITSKLLYILGDADTYIVMNLLNQYYADDTSEYDLKKADTFALHSGNGNLTELASCMNYHIICDAKERDYVVSKFAVYATELGVDTQTLMGTIEDLNQYIQTCFDDVKFLNLGDYSVEEMKALSTMKDYRNLSFDVQETKLHLPYILITK
jgi:hypothetical protein